MLGPLSQGVAMDRKGPRYHTKVEARQLSQDKFWWIILGVFSIVGGVTSIVLMTVTISTPERVDLSPIFPIMSSLVFATIMGLVFGIRKPTDPAVAKIIDTEEAQRLFARGDELEEIYKRNLSVKEHCLKIRLLLGPWFKDRRLPSEFLEFESYVRGNWGPYEKLAEDLHDTQCALLDPIYAKLGKPNPLRA